MSNICDDCTHKTCDAARATARAECLYCCYQIGFDVPYIETAHGLAHIDCVPRRVPDVADAPYRDATDIDPYPYGSMKAAPVTP